MKIAGYRTLTERERDYLTIRCLLQKYGMLECGVSYLNIAQDLDKLREDLCLPVGSVLNSVTQLLEFRLAYNDSPDYHLRLNELPEGTTELFIETK